MFKDETACGGSYFPLDSPEGVVTAFAGMTNCINI
jgi:hypothetical protein